MQTLMKFLEKECCANTLTDKGMQKAIRTRMTRFLKGLLQNIVLHNELP